MNVSHYKVNHILGCDKHTCKGSPVPLACCQGGTPLPYLLFWRNTVGFGWWAGWKWKDEEEDNIHWEVWPSYNALSCLQRCGIGVILWVVWISFWILVDFEGVCRWPLKISFVSGTAGNSGCSWDTIGLALINYDVRTDFLTYPGPTCLPSKNPVKYPVRMVQ